jgi:hypothetical protein
VRADLQERARVPGLTVEGLPRSPALPLDGRNRRARPGEAAPRARASAVERDRFDEPTVERARDMERDDQSDQKPAGEMPDENAVLQRLILGACST